LSAVPDSRRAAAAVPIQDALLRHQVLIQRLSSSEVAKFKPFLRDMDHALRDELADASITDLERYRLEKLLSVVDTLMAGILNRFSKQLLLDLEEFARHEARFSAGALDAATTFDAIIPSVTQIRAAILSTPLGVKGSSRGALLKSFVENWTQTEVRAVNGAIRRGAFEGKTNQAIVSELRGSRARNYQDGLLDVTRRHAEAVVRTAVQHVATIAREETFANNSDIIKAYQWLATLDRRSCVVCRSLDGREFQPGSGPRPPIHPQCRCTLVPRLKDEFAYLQAGETRASKGAEGGKQVAGDLSYYEWLREQPASFQDQAIGPTRGLLLRNGGLSAERFAKLQVDKTFAPLTLNEMKKIDPISFRRAGL
jgi:SPP1 gp7 family putative phage head morphogenesis protein